MLRRDSALQDLWGILYRRDPGEKSRQHIWPQMQIINIILRQQLNICYADTEVLYVNAPAFANSSSAHLLMNLPALTVPLLCLSAEVYRPQCTSDMLSAHGLLVLAAY